MENMLHLMNSLRNGMIFLVHKFKIIYLETFQKDLARCLISIQFYSNNSLNSNKFYIKLEKIVDILKDFPEIFPIIKIRNEIVRKIVINQFIIIYQINYNQKEILFLHIFHYKQNYLSKSKKTPT